MSNPFPKSLRPLRGKRVRAVATNGDVFEGFVERMHYHDRHLVLRGAIDAETGASLGRVFVAHADSVAVLDTERVECVTLAEIDPAPYHQSEFHREDNRQYIADVRAKGFVGSFPVVRELRDRYQVVEGHKRLWVAREAGLDEHPVEIVDATDWEVAERFAADHLASAEQIHTAGEVPDGYYRDDPAERAVRALVARWGDRAPDLPNVADTMDRLGLWRLVDDDPTPPRTSTPFESALEGGASVVDDAPDTVLPVDDGPVDDDPVREGPLHVCEHADCDFSSDSERGLAIHEGRVHADDGPAGLEKRITVALKMHEELSGREIIEKLEASQHCWNVLSSLVDDGRVETRKDPDDGRRKLYSLVDGESTTADAPTPATVTDGGAIPVVQDAPGTVDPIEPATPAAPQPTPPTPGWTDYSAETGTGRSCGNCGHHLTKEFIRVFEADESEARCCPNCDNLIREGDGTVREKRSTGGQ